MFGVGLTGDLTQNPLLLRLEAVNAFTLLLKGAGKAATEPVLKELTKHLKNGLVDKALVMRVACAQVGQWDNPGSLAVI